MSEPAHAEMCHGRAGMAIRLLAGPGWRPADSLLRLFDQLNAMYPDRDHASDGTIGDPAHCPGPSDHCPKSIPGLGDNVVTAGDYDHDPTSGADMERIAEALRKSRDKRIAYVIFNRHIFSATVQPWVWRPYTGTNPHTSHLHLSVVHNALADDTTPWEIDMTFTKEDIRLLSDATAAKVLGRSWAVAGRTLAGSIEALLNWHPITMAILTDIRDDPNNTFDPTDEELQLVADRLAERLPSGGTFTLSGPGMPS